MHPQDEYLETSSGAFAYLVDGKETPVQHPGDRALLVPAGITHTFWNAEPDNPGVLFAYFTPQGNVQLQFGDAQEIRMVATV